MAKTSMAAKAWKLGGVTEVLFTPYEDGVKGTTQYVLEDIVGDTTNITQEDPTTNEIACETRDEPIFENITLGKYTFTTTSGDIQDDVLVKALGFTKNTAGTEFYAPTSYKEIWGEFEVVFGTKGSLVCPKVKLNGKIEAATLKTGMVQATLTGTCYSASVGEVGKEVMTPFYPKKPATGGA